MCFTKAYSELESACSGLNVIVATYIADIPAEAFKTLTSLPGVAGFTFDLIRGEKTLDLIKSSFPTGKYLFAGVVDGRSIWANDLAGSLAGHKNETFFSANAAVQDGCPTKITRKLGDADGLAPILSWRPLLYAHGRYEELDLLPTKRVIDSNSSSIPVLAKTLLLLNTRLILLHGQL
ncbi:unnamed protein product [Lactuca virosa]|uniref:Cobalamin-independent methionine synthase MetE N-terminal domain-containing protein n=1 Tax=Lactuca virosa TaxID=75947 RepID=A0AAU9N131_9ASTR|nr:unnamed protein product [Lactuca virosa]